jgi:hypothetical protein
MRATPKKETLAKTGCISVMGGLLLASLFILPLRLLPLLYLLGISKCQKIIAVSTIALIFTPR